MTTWDIVLFTLKGAAATFLLAAFTILILSGISGVINWMDEQ